MTTSAVCGTVATTGIDSTREAELLRLFCDAIDGAPGDLETTLLGRARIERRSGPGLVTAAKVAADIVVSSLLEREWTPERTTRLVDTVAAAARTTTADAQSAICTLALRHPQLHELPPPVGAEAVLRILCALAPVAGASLWDREAGAGIRRLSGVGDAAFHADARAAAAACLTEAGEAFPEAVLPAVRVVLWERTTAALVVLPEEGQAREASARAEEAAAALAVIVQRDLLLSRANDRARELTASAERRVARLGCDIHDGPLQDLAVVGIDLATLRAQLAPALPEGPRRQQVIDRLGATLERLIAVESDLRALSASLEPSGAADRPLSESLERLVVTLGAQHSIRARVEVHGDTSGATPSQRIAIARVVGESLRNAAEHGRAAVADVQVEARRNGIHVAVRDEGCGFDGDAEVADAARRGRLGVLSMSERVRLLGGHFDIRSRRGGPTVVTVHLPWWRPLADGADELRATRTAG